MSASPTPLLLIGFLPDLAHELEALLNKQDETELALQVPALRIVDRCRCGDDFCSSFYTQPKPSGSYGADHRTLELNADAGFLILDILGKKIVHVEVLYRDEIRRQLLTILPEHPCRAIARHHNILTPGS